MSIIKVQNCLHKAVRLADTFQWILLCNVQRPPDFQATEQPTAPTDSQFHWDDRYPTKKTNPNSHQQNSQTNIDCAVQYLQFLLIIHNDCKVLILKHFEGCIVERTFFQQLN